MKCPILKFTLIVGVFLLTTFAVQSQNIPNFIHAVEAGITENSSLNEYGNDPIFITEQVLVKEGYTKITPIIAVYDTITERIQIARYWGPWTSIDYTKDSAENKVENLIKACYDTYRPEETCLIWVLEETPATFETVTERVLSDTHSDGWGPTSYPTTYKTITKKSLKTPAFIQCVPQAIYKDLPLDSLVQIYCPSQNPKMLMAWKREHRRNQTDQTEKIINPAQVLGSIEVFPAVYKTESKQVDGQTIVKEVLQSPAIFCSVKTPVEEFAPFYELVKQSILVTKQPSKGFTHCLDSNTDKSTVLIWEVPNYEPGGEWLVKNIEGSCTHPTGLIPDVDYPRDACPAIYQTVTRVEIKSPGHGGVQVFPPEYKTVLLRAPKKEN